MAGALPFMPQSPTDRGFPEIETLIPHRAPFRFVDRITALDAEEGCCALDLAADDPRLQRGVLPPLFLIEALAQSAAAYHGCALKLAGSKEIETGMLVQLDAVALHAPARAGDTVALTVRRTHQLGAMVRFAGRAQVGVHTLAEAQLTVARGSHV